MPYASVVTRYGLPEVLIPRRYSSLGWTTRMSVTGTPRMVATQTAFGLLWQGCGPPGVNGSGRRLVQTPRRAAAPLIFYPGRFGNAARTPPQSIEVACIAHRGERLGPPIVTHAEPHNLYTLTAEIESPTKRAESAIWAV
jgi:hypothetical protein